MCLSGWEIQSGSQKHGAALHAEPEPTCGPGGVVRPSACVAGRPAGPVTGRRPWHRTDLGPRRAPNGPDESAGARGATVRERGSSDVAWVRRCVRIWSITADGVMQATIRVGPAQCGHASGSPSTICCRTAAQRGEAPVGASRGVVTIGTGASARAHRRGRAPPGAASRAADWRTTVGPRGHRPGVGDGGEPPRETLQWVGGLGAGGGALGRVGAVVVTCLAARSYVRRSSATGFRAQSRARRFAKARSSSGIHTAVWT